MSRRVTLELVGEIADLPAGMEDMMNRVAEACCAAEGLEKVMVCARLVDDEEIWALNRRMRGVDRSTDVLSFPSVSFTPEKTAGHCKERLKGEWDPDSGRMFLGEMVISLDHAMAQAEEYGHSLSREVGYLTAHSMFHLMGYDHMQPGDKAAMRAMEEGVMREVGLSRNQGTQGMSDSALFERAEKAMEQAYAPYSGFLVGACLLDGEGRVYEGCNIENASYGASICAERVAVSCAVSQGARRFTAIAVCGSTAPAWPCGICRQVLNEFSEDMRVIAGEKGKGYEVRLLSELLPQAFGPEKLDK